MVETVETAAVVAKPPVQVEETPDDAGDLPTTFGGHEVLDTPVFSATSDAIVGVAEGADMETRQWAEVMEKLSPPLMSYLFSDTLRWGPTGCLPPIYYDPAPSKAEAGAHSRKLYLLWVREYEPYAKVTEQPVGQTIWKLTWYPAADAKPGERKPGKRGPTFIMHKLDPATEGNRRRMDLCGD